MGPGCSHRRGVPYDPEEGYLIEAGTAIVVRLPNGTELRINAE